MDGTSVKVLLTGDSESGKKFLFDAFSKIQGKEPFTYPSEYTQENPVEVQILNAGEFTEESEPEVESVCFDQYPPADVVILCFSLYQADGLEKVKGKFLHQVKKHSPKAPIVVVGTKSDLQFKHGPGQAEIRRLIYDIGAETYIECTAYTSLDGQFAVKSVFKKAVGAVLRVRSGC